MKNKDMKKDRGDSGTRRDRSVGSGPLVSDEPREKQGGRRYPLWFPNARMPRPSQPDASALLRWVQELEALSQDLMGMIENSSDAFAVVDGESHLLLLNPAFERVMGLKSSDIPGKRTRFAPPKRKWRSMSSS